MTLIVGQALKEGVPNNTKVRPPHTRRRATWDHFMIQPATLAILNSKSPPAALHQEVEVHYRSSELSTGGGVPNTNTDPSPVPCPSREDGDSGRGDLVEQSS
jgi:hypothetical protein